MNRSSPAFRCAFAFALAGICALPFWNTACRTAYAFYDEDPIYVTADATRTEKGITSYVMTKPSATEIHVLVISETRAAEIQFNDKTAQTPVTMQVTMTGSGEILTITAPDVWHGSVSVNGTQIASWQHLQGDNWEYIAFGNLNSYTSWHVLGDVLTDANARPVIQARLALLPVIAVLVAIAGIIVAVVIGYTNLHFQRITAIINHNASCVSAGHMCAEADYDPLDPACAEWFNNCNGTDSHIQWCVLLEQACSNGDQSACDRHDSYCFNP